MTLLPGHTIYPSPLVSCFNYVKEYLVYHCDIGLDAFLLTTIVILSDFLSTVSPTLP